MLTCSCGDIANWSMCIAGHITGNTKPIGLCCEVLPGKNSRPSVGFYETPEETLRQFMWMRMSALTEGNNINKPISNGCKACKFYTYGNWQFNSYIDFVNLSMYPAPCQCNCIYCVEKKSIKENMNTTEVKTAYEKTFDFLKYLKSSGFVHPKATWMLASGEITIHPYREEMLNLVRDHEGGVWFFSNCFIYDEEIAMILRKNPNALIEFSIDCGKDETWQKIKGLNNFQTVLNNLMKYRMGINESQIKFKYILLPGINDQQQEYGALVNIMKSLGIQNLKISRDWLSDISHTNSTTNNVEKALAKLVNTCKQNGIQYEFNFFTDDEIQNALRISERVNKDEN